MTGVAWAGLTGLDLLMARCAGESVITIGLLDGPVYADHPGLRPGALTTTGAGAPSRHGTAVAGVLSANRDSGAPGICPGCTVIAVPVFDAEGSADPGDLAAGLVTCVREGARLINVSAAFTGTVPLNHPLRQALDFAAAHGAIVVAAAGNSGRIGGSQLLAHPAVVPVASCDEAGRPQPGGDLGGSIGRRGVLAPGTPVPSLAPDGGLAPFGGTSLAAALVTGALALAWSIDPDRPVQQLRAALAGRPAARRSIAPPLLDAAALAPRQTEVRT